ncbi:MAG: HAD-IA family hydrolase, partial [Bacteroidaceae bacterium]|nr:HAD-IA family hydrolase [Bacteroidaceae bacterium]
TVLVDCGSICKCLEHATGLKPDITLGKPDPNMLIGILQQKNLHPEEIAMVGDRIYTDIAMAQNAGAVGVLVLSGETTMNIAKEAINPPDIIVQNIEELGNLIEKAQQKIVKRVIVEQNRAIL